MTGGPMLFLLLAAVVVTCFFGGWYAYRKPLGGLVTAVIGPIVLLVFWWILRVVFTYSLLMLVNVLPEFVGDAVEGFFERVLTMPGWLLFVLNPATVACAVGFFFFCRYERTNTAPHPEGFSDPCGRGYDGQPLPSENPKVVPTIRRFEY